MYNAGRAALGEMMHRPWTFRCALSVFLMGCQPLGDATGPTEDVGTTPTAAQPFQQGNEWALEQPNEGLQATIDAFGTVDVTRADAAWNIRLTTDTVGRPGHERAWATDAPQLGGCSLSEELDSEGSCLRQVQRRDTTASEWWSADSRGLESGWTFDSRPPGEGNLRIGVLVEGASVNVSANGRFAHFQGDDVRLRYDSLVAWDARGQKLPARLEPAFGGFRISVDDATATYPITVDPMLFDPQVYREVNIANAELGSAVTVGDFNGDGLGDLAVGMRGWDVGTNNGALLVYLQGVGTGLPASPTFTVIGFENYHQLGSAMVAEDLTGDGMDDLAVTAAGSTGSSIGRIYIYAGHADLGTGAMPAWTSPWWTSDALDISATETKESNGIDIGLADANGDGMVDIFTTSNANITLANEGQALQYLSQDLGGGNWTFETSPSWMARGLQANRMMWYLSERGADVDGDGHDELLVMQEGYVNNTYVDQMFYGSSTGLETTSGWSATGTSSSNNGGNPVIHDFDQDGWPEIALAKRSATARVYHNVGGVVDSLYDQQLTNGAGAPYSSSGVGDIDGDGWDDWILSGYGNGDGYAHVHRGGPDGLRAPVSGRVAVLGLGPSSQYAFGDVNDDGETDMIVGIRTYSGPESSEGRVVIQLGPALVQSPVATADSATLNEGQSKVIDVVANDTDGDGHTLTPVIVDGTAHGTLVVGGDRKITYTHDGSETTSDSFTYSASDGDSLSTPVTVTITVNAVNDLPVAEANGPYSITEGDVLQFDSAGTTDADSTVATWDGMQFEWNCDGDADYEGFGVTFNGCPTTLAGNYTSVLSVDDNQGGSDTDTATLTIANIVPDITTTPGTAATAFQSYSYVPTVNVSTADTVTWSYSSLPNGATFNATNGRVSWTPGYADATGAFSIKLQDEEGTYERQTWTVTVDRDLDNDGQNATAASGPDCDDTNATIFVGATEILDTIDQDCDGLIDDNTEGYDDDDDGFTELDGDCDDAVDTISPDGIEVLNGLDDDCDGTTDNHLPSFDDDGDGFTEDAGDLDDADNTVYPEAVELPDGKDNNGDGKEDEGTVNGDDDLDGFTELEGDCDDANLHRYPLAPETCEDMIDMDCDEELSSADLNDNDIPDCTEPDAPDLDNDGDGFTEVAGDCDDDDDSIHPEAVEIVDGIDQDCDLVIDDNTVIFDDDEDGYTEEEGDCDDYNPDASPEGVEEFNWADDDCDGLVDNHLASYDDDGDGFSEDQFDCDDENPMAYPDAPESCADEIDLNCDDEIQYEDLNEDGVADCTQPTEIIDNDGDGYTEDEGDCDDSEGAGADDRYPGADEDCEDTLDMNCDDQIAFVDDNDDGINDCLPEDTDTGETGETDDTNPDTGDTDDGVVVTPRDECGCDTGANPTPALGLLTGLLAFYRRKRQ